MQEDCLIIRIPKFTGYKTLAFNLTALIGGGVCWAAGALDAFPATLVAGMGAVNVLLRLMTSTPVWSQREPGAGGGGSELPVEPEYRSRLPVLRPVPHGTPEYWRSKYARQTVAPTVPRPVCVGEALAVCVAAEPASLPIWGEEKFPEFLYKQEEARQNAPEGFRGRLHGFLAFALVGALALFPLAACGALSELGTAIAGQPLAGARE